MKNIFKKIDLSFLFILVIFLAFIAGLFFDMMAFVLVIMVHGLGHVLMSKKLGWHIKKVSLDLCGGKILYDEVLDKPFIEELKVATSGILMQLLFFLFIFLLRALKIIDVSFFDLLIKYNTAIIVFNLLPIIPLDGAKVLGVLFFIKYPYKKALKILNIASLISLFMILFIFYFKKIAFNFSYLMIISLLIKENVKFFKNIPYLFNQFLFERYVNMISVKRYIILNKKDLRLLRRQKKHYFYDGKKYVSERELLSKRFD